MNIITNSPSMHNPTSYFTCCTMKKKRTRGAMDESLIHPSTIMASILPVSRATHERKFTCLRFPFPFDKIQSRLKTTGTCSLNRFTEITIFLFSEEENFFGWKGTRVRQNRKKKLR